MLGFAGAKRKGYPTCCLEGEVICIKGGWRDVLLDISGAGSCSSWVVNMRSISFSCSPQLVRIFPSHHQNIVLDIEEHYFTDVEDGPNNQVGALSFALSKRLDR